MVSDEDFRALLARVEQLERIMPAIDRDVAAIQAQRRADLELLMALRGTQLEQGERIEHLDGKVDAGFADIRSEIRAGFDSIVGLLGRIVEPEGE